MAPGTSAPTSSAASCESGRDVVVLDDLSSGHREFVPDGVPLVEGSVVDPSAVEEALTGGKVAGGATVTGVVHLAGFKYAGVSVQRPLHTYEQNVTGMQVLLGRMLDLGVTNLVFSSSAATFGTPDVDLVTEQTPTHPESPYGESKLVGEWLIRDVAADRGLRHTSLRYFNVVGSGYDDLYDTSPHNLFPLVLKALTEGGTPKVFGTDYPTPDGSCVRDYVHVQDLALAHVAAADRLERGRAARAGLQPRQRRRASRCCRSWTPSAVSPGSTSSRSASRAAPATPPASSPPASSPRATSTGGCGTTSTTWSPAPGAPGSVPARIAPKGSPRGAGRPFRALRRARTIRRRRSSPRRPRARSHRDTGPGALPPREGGSGSRAVRARHPVPGVGSPCGPVETTTGWRGGQP